MAEPRTQLALAEQGGALPLPRTTLWPTIASAPIGRPAWAPYGRAALLGGVLLYLAAVLVGPIVALAAQVARLGLREVFAALGQPDALAALRMSIVLTVISTAINAVVGVVGALAITRQRFLGRNLINALADLPLAISPVMIGLAFMLLAGRNGWLAGPLATLGLQVLFAFPGLLIATLFVTLPFTLREVAYVLEEIGTSEEEAAATLGASPWQTFWRVTLPNIRVGLGYGLLMSVARSLGEFGAVLVLGGSISGHTQTATTFIHAAIEERERAGAYGMALLLAAISVALWALLEVVKRKRAARH
jgi:sulfate transport system permease protein